MMSRLPLHRPARDRQQLELFRSVPGDHAVRDSQDLMAWPFFSLAKSKRVAPIDFRMGATWISVEAVPEHGMATIWDADVLVWAASQIVEARDAGRPTSRLMVTTPHEILAFIGRGTGRDHYDRLKAALDRLQSTTVATSIRQQHQRRRHRFSWINEWRELADENGRARGIELILPDWFHAGVADRALVLTIDRAYFSVPVGLYVLRPAERLAAGDLVAVTPPKPLAWFLAARHYLPLDTPLMKRVMGLPGQRVCRTGNAVTVDAVPLGDALDRDRHGRPLPVWRGCRRIAAGEVFLMNPSVPDSLDGRYFGPLPSATIIGTATPLYTDEAGNGRFVWRAATR